MACGHPRSSISPGLGRTRAAVRWFLRLLFTLIVGGIIVAGAVAYWSYRDLQQPGPSTADTTVVIASGTSVGGIARQLEEAGVVRDARTFYWRARFLPQG